MKKWRLNIIVLTVILLKTSGIYAQDNKIISGRVTTFGSIPLYHVEITVSKSGPITYSDTLGFFSISCSEKDALKFFANGFDGEKIKAKKCNQATIDLIYSNDETSFKHATINKHISKEVLEMAIENYPLKGEFNYSKYDNIYILIDNEIHNVRVSGTSITTTKPNSFSASQEVLYVVDGMTTIDISFVVPLNVKSIRYVDGPEAAKYGSRGANGAIEITLK